MQFSDFRKARIDIWRLKMSIYRCRSASGSPQTCDCCKAHAQVNRQMETWSCLGGYTRANFGFTLLT